MLARPVDAEPVAIQVEDLAAEFARLCPESGIDLAGAVTLRADLEDGGRGDRLLHIISHSSRFSGAE